ncbi:MAG: putative addiction module component [Pseudomonadota bacterium]|jgi:hypothetical protein
MMDYAEIEQQALQLSVLQQVSLLRKLSLNLNGLSDTDYEQLCLEEAARRAQEIEEGKVVGISGEQVFEKLRQNLKNFK